MSIASNEARNGGRCQGHLAPEGRRWFVYVVKFHIYPTIVDKSLKALIFLQLALTVPLNVFIVRPALASISVKFARQLHVTPLPLLGKVSIARFPEESEVNNTIDPTLELKQLKAVVTV